MPAPRDEHECKLRRRFDSKQHAQAAALRIFHAQQKHREASPCRLCYGWHLEQAN